MEYLVNTFIAISITAIIILIVKGLLKNKISPRWYFKKPKVFWTSIGVIAAIVIGAICLTNPMGQKVNLDNLDNIVNGLDYEKIYECKTLYVGNASKVGTLLSYLYYQEYRDGLSLQTEAEPYGVTVNYLVKDGPLAQSGEIQETDKMLKNAAIMFCLIDNVEEINFTFQDGKAEKTFSFDRQGFNEIFKEDIRKYSTTFALFKDDFIPRLEKENWAAVSNQLKEISPYEAVKLPPFKYKAEDEIEEMVYQAALQQCSENKDENSVTIVAPHIFGTYKEGNELRIFATIYDHQFKLDGKNLYSGNAGIIPVAIVYVINDDGTYSFKEYIQAMDGAYFKTSIEEFCHPRKDIAQAMLNHYGNYEDLFELMKENLIYYLKANNMKGINLKKHDDSIIPLT